VYSGADQIVLAILPPVVAWLVVSGVDDLVLFTLWIYLKCGRSVPPPPEPPKQRPLAIFIPLWHEDAVVRAMVTQNVTAIRYRNYAIFIGAYPNDTPTLDAVRDMESRFENVHLCIVPHDGPTSKADCLNWIYQSMLIHEDSAATRFAAIITHDAEDVIHGESLSAINAHLDRYDMIQVPVIPLPTPLSEIVHGIYIDEFCEFQKRDLWVRWRCGGFLPSAGVGTAFSRKAVERLAELGNNRVFEPACLTEDYENGFKVRALGYRQILLPLDRTSPATREYFPRTWHTAAKQRTRWATGIVWQGLEQHGWKGGPSQWWWHWRDRKGIIGHPVGLLANAIFVYGLVSPIAHPLLPLTIAFAMLQALTRAAFVGAHYGWAQGAMSVVRIPAANLLNTIATMRATRQYWLARARGEQIPWLKTAHQYPNRFALEPHRPGLREILVQSAYCTETAIESALAAKPPGTPFGPWLVTHGVITEEELYEAMSLQHALPLEFVHPWDIPRGAARALPAHVLRELEIVPLRCDNGQLVIGAPEAIPERVLQALAQYTTLAVRVALITRSNYETLRARCLPEHSAAGD
jgi:adsorption protein B